MILAVILGHLGFPNATPREHASKRQQATANAIAVVFGLFSDSTIKAATNAQQWYVTVSRGRRGVRIFTPDKEQLRENIVRSGDRALAIDLVGERFLRRLGIPLRLRNRCRRNRAFAVGFRQRMLDCWAALRRRGVQQTPTVQVQL